ncbi:MAG: prenyltransferase, partial [Acidilobaceae archaeon]
MTSLIKKSLNNIVLSFLKIPIWKEKFGVYWRFLRPETSLSTILAGLGGIFYGCKTTEECIIFESILAVIGVTLAHLSVNALNEIQDYKSGLDRETLKTPFSGGTKILVEGKISLTEAFVLATLTFIVALSIGLYLSALYGLVLLLFVIAGALIILLYDPYLLRLGLGEFGAFMRSVLVFLGCAYVATKELHTSAIFLGATYGALSTITLYINHLADVKVDIKYGRRTLPILLKEKVWIGYFLVLMI